MKSVRVFFLLAMSGAYQRWRITLVTTDAGFSLRTYDGCTRTSPSFAPVLIAYPILQSASMPQALEPAASKLHRRNSGMISLLPQVSDDGAVVFASQRKDVKFLDMTWMDNYIVVLITPIGISNLGWKYYLIYAVLNAVFVPVVYVETAGLSLEEIDKIFESEYTERRPENELISGVQSEKEHFEQVAHF
jgi:hypothetical protein